jgi:mannitol/fructose-specific phosphotransferase system IIA component (Ntr-type)
MDFIEKARNRLVHWISHNDHQQEAYEMFAEQLEEVGKIKSSEHVREMVKLTAKSSECLRKAIKAIE